MYAGVYLKFSTMKNGIWFSEKHTDEILYLYKVKEVIYHGRTKFQRVDILDLYHLGITLFLDERIQSAQIDEAVYHEMLTHVAMFSHPEPQRILILGGGEGATLREVLKHPSVKEAHMVDIDDELVELCRKYMPSWSAGAFEDHRAKLSFVDARTYVEETNSIFDVIISDLTEPIEEGPSIKLFTREFYMQVYNKLSDDGIFIAQAGSIDPIYPNFAASLYTTLKTVFPIVRIYTEFIFSFQLPWAFVIASKSIDPLKVDMKLLEKRMELIGKDSFQHYYPERHLASFNLPKYFLKSIDEKGVVIKDDAPFIWQA